MKISEVILSNVSLISFLYFINIYLILKKSDSFEFNRFNWFSIFIQLNSELVMLVNKYSKLFFISFFLSNKISLNI